MRSTSSLLLTALLFAGSVLPCLGQMRKIHAEIVPLVATDGVHAGDNVRAAITVTLPEGFHMQSNAPRNPLLIPTSLEMLPTQGVQFIERVYPATIDFKQEDVEQSLAVFERRYSIGISLKLDSSLAAGELTIPLTLKYQPCDESMCYPPTSVSAELTLRIVPSGAPLAPIPDHAAMIDSIAFGSGEDSAAGKTAVPPPAAAPAPDEIEAGLRELDRFTIAGTAGGYLSSSDFLRFLKDAESGVKQAGMFDGRGPLAIILLVLLGGFALNLTPCVLPMIPINLAIIGAGTRAGSPRRGFLLGATYGLAMAIVYGILGLVVILTAGSFGTINASPWFNLGIALLFVGLGLAMFDLFTIDLSRWSGSFTSGAKRGSFVLAFSMGAVAALLAGACVAPVVIQVVLFASNLYATGTRTALALPFFLGLGMAIPWPLAGAGLSALPKPGAWMTRVKQAFGVLIIGSALYYGYVSYEIFSRHGGNRPTASPVVETLQNGWVSSLSQGLETAEREHKPVIIDLWASWCKNCLTMDHTTFRDPDVNAALSGYVKVRVAAENPDQEPTRSLIQRFKAVGLPTYVILKPGSSGK